jgi:thiazole synthase
MTNDVLIIGGGAIGLAIAVELKLRGASVTVLCRDFHAAASLAAAGMLAPQAEKIPPGAMLDLCLLSRSLYPEWTRKLEEISGKPTGYRACGILAPVYEIEESGVRSQDYLSPPASPAIESPPAYWLDKEAIHLYQPGLSEAVVGGWWYPEDAQVNNRALTLALWSAAESLGVTLRDGIIVEGILQQQRQVVGVQTSIGIFNAAHYVLATGAWSQELLPLPIRPKKGQMLSVRVPEHTYNDLSLDRVLFAPDIYIVPRRSASSDTLRDRLIVIGATSEDVGFTPYNTPAGIQTLLERAIRLYPQLQNYPINELWWGFRPATPDELPILGCSACTNLTLATGHYRNGILLAPITASLIADSIWNQKFDPLLEHFHYSRFYKDKSQESGVVRAGLTDKLVGTQTEPLNPPVQNTGVRIHKSEERIIQPSSFILHPSPSPSQYPSAKMQTLDYSTEQALDRPLTIAGRTFQSRLMTGTGKYRSIEEMQQSVAASGCQIVTVAVRRVQTLAPGHEGLAEALDWTKIWMLPNTAGCQTAEEAVRVARLGREMAKLLGQEDNNFVKLEVIPDQKYLLPDPIGTLEAAEKLVKEGFAVLPYINADPMLAKRLEDVGCATVMPLASPIGSGQGLKTTANIQIIIENAGVPVVVDAGIGTPSEAAQAMEMGADALLINTAIAGSKNPAAMARAMNLATVAGRLAYLAGRIPIKTYASASSPHSGTIAS